MSWNPKFTLLSLLTWKWCFQTPLISHLIHEVHPGFSVSAPPLDPQQLSAIPIYWPHHFAGKICLSLTRLRTPWQWLVHLYLWEKGKKTASSQETLVKWKPGLGGDSPGYGSGCVCVQKHMSTYDICEQRHIPICGICVQRHTMTCDVCVQGHTPACVYVNKGIHLLVVYVYKGIYHIWPLHQLRCLRKKA